MSKGFRIGANNRFIMYQNCGPITRIGQWTNLENGTGTEVDDNSKILVKRAAKVACFREDPPIPPTSIPNVVITNSSSTLCRNGSAGVYNGSLNQSHLTYPLTYTWEISPIGIGNYSVVSSYTSNNNEGFYSLVPSALPPIYDFVVFIRLTITDAIGISGHAIYQIELIDCFNDEVDSRNSLHVEDNSDEIIIYPNPVTDELQIKGIKNENIVHIYDIKGNLVLKQENLLKSNIDTFSLAAGLYIIKIHSNQQLKVLKFNKI